MTPAPCPNCSGIIHETYGDRWVISHPTIIKGRWSGQYRIVGCCAFSSKSTLAYSSEDDACAAWSRYRDAMAARDSRLKFMLEQLNALDQRLNPCRTGNTPA
jgi:hypothetical protein